MAFPAFRAEAAAASVGINFADLATDHKAAGCIVKKGKHQPWAYSEATAQITRGEECEERDRVKMQLSSVELSCSLSIHDRRVCGQQTEGECVWQTEQMGDCQGVFLFYFILF